MSEQAVKDDELLGVKRQQTKLSNASGEE